jgi:maltose O-acetyltransferase
MKKFLLLYSWFVWMITFFMPDSKLTMRLRGFLYSFGMPKCGKNFQVSSSAKLIGLDKLFFGNNVFIASNVTINSGGKIYLKDDVMIGIGSVIVAGNHTLDNGSYRFGHRCERDITIGSGSWIAANCTLVAGVKFPDSSLLAANSVYVTKNNKTAGVYGGVPAKLLNKN